MFTRLFSLALVLQLCPPGVVHGTRFIPPASSAQSDALPFSVNVRTWGDAALLTIFEMPAGASITGLELKQHTLKELELTDGEIIAVARTILDEETLFIVSHKSGMPVRALIGNNYTITAADAGDSYGHLGKEKSPLAVYFNTAALAKRLLESGHGEEFLRSGLVKVLSRQMSKHDHRSSDALKALLAVAENDIRTVCDASVRIQAIEAIGSVYGDKSGASGAGIEAIKSALGRRIVRGDEDRTVQAAARKVLERLGGAPAVPEANDNASSADHLDALIEVVEDCDMTKYTANERMQAIMQLTELAVLAAAPNGSGIPGLWTKREAIYNAFVAATADRELYQLAEKGMETLSDVLP